MLRVSFTRCAHPHLRAHSRMADMRLNSAALSTRALTGLARGLTRVAPPGCAVTNPSDASQRYALATVHGATAKSRASCLTEGRRSSGRNRPEEASPAAAHAEARSAPPSLGRVRANGLSPSSQTRGDLIASLQHEQGRRVEPVARRGGCCANSPRRRLRRSRQRCTGARSGMDRDAAPSTAIARRMQHGKARLRRRRHVGLQ